MVRKASRKMKSRLQWRSCCRALTPLTPALCPACRQPRGSLPALPEPSRRIPGAPGGSRSREGPLAAPIPPSPAKEPLPDRSASTFSFQGFTGNQCKAEKGFAAAGRSPCGGNGSGQAELCPLWKRGSHPSAELLLPSPAPATVCAVSMALKGEGNMFKASAVAFAFHMAGKGAEMIYNEFRRREREKTNKVLESMMNEAFQDFSNKIKALHEDFKTLEESTKHEVQIIGAELRGNEEGKIHPQESPEQRPSLVSCSRRKYQ
ncbi:uncharacterized protein LOC121361551 [Pyrgilauda ruficollis]|uniref:uncharacterized protein LOC121361551 n=1 Tax=Pyrgilauda ruficollis TaxID=221976 RepID=UPI001B881B32|nr:uncharacterized protein LOC121361551 [Pyrgilauda ruficollis]